MSMSIIQAQTKLYHAEKAFECASDALNKAKKRGAVNISIYERRLNECEKALDEAREARIEVGRKVRVYKR